MVSSRGNWLAHERVFLKNGFENVGSAPPSFSLLVKKIKAAMAELEEEARAEAAKKLQEQGEKEAEAQKKGKKRRGRKPQEPSEKPDVKAQRNFTDPDSRIMKDGASKAFEQTYNCQAIVDSEAQVICASGVTQDPNDKQQVVPVVLEILHLM